MQTIYIDVFIFINVFEDFLLLLCTKRILKLNISYLRILAGSFSGGLISLLALLPNLNFMLNIFTDFVTTLIMVLITFGFKGKKAFAKSFLTLLIVSFLFSGAMIFFYLTLNPIGMAVINNRVYFNISPALLIILTLLIYFILFTYKKLFSNHVNSSHVHTVEFFINNTSYEFKCKYDSGCNLKEPFSGSDVIIVEEKILEGLTVPDKLKRIIPYNSLGGNGIIYGFKPDSVKIDNTEQSKEIYIGLCNNVIKSEIKGLIPQNLLEG